MATSGKFSPHRNRLSDRDMLLVLLSTEKYMSHLYDHAIMEATCDTVRDTFVALQEDEHETAQMVFDFMHQRGWYSTGANRQKSGRRLQGGQRLSGGKQQFRGGDMMQPQADSRYAVTSGSRNLGQNLRGGGRGQGDKQPAWAGQDRRGGRSDDRPEWYY